MSFRFPLQSLLRLRKSLEKQEEMKLQALNGHLARVRQDVATVEQQERNERYDLDGRMQSGVSGAEILLALAHRRFRQQQRQKLLREQRRFEEEHSIRQLAYRKVRQKREILSNFRERRLTAFTFEQDRRWQDSLDELLLLRRRFRRTRRSA